MHVINMLQSRVLRSRVTDHVDKFLRLAKFCRSILDYVCLWTGEET